MKVKKKHSIYICVILFSLINSSYSIERFNPTFISGVNSDVVDLALLENGDNQSPGLYRVEVYLNDEYKKTIDLSFFVKNSSDDNIFVNGERKKNNHNLYPCLNKNFLLSLDINPKNLSIENQKSECINLSAIIKDSGVYFDFSNMKLYISIPQVALLNNSRGYIPSSEWTEGITSAILDYTFTGNNSKDNKYHSSNYYLNLNSGINFSVWRLRNSSSLNNTSTDKDNKTQWKNISTYIQRNIISIKSLLTIGDTSTSSEIFDSLGIRGVVLSSDENMLPDSLRGFAPSVRGIAETNAKVTIRQNGYIIYQTYVSPGAFNINDLYPTSNSGDLEVTITENNGHIQIFTVPYSSVPILQREGQIKYMFAAGKYRSGNSLKDSPTFAQGTFMFGLPKNITIYGGTQLSNNYKAINFGTGVNLGSWGALSSDITQAYSTLSNNNDYSGQSIRLLYSKSLNNYGTRFQLLGYRYSTKGFYSLGETTYKNLYSDFYNNINNELQPFNYNNAVYNKKEKIQININQQINDFGSFYLSGSRQTYWNSNKSIDTLTMGINSSWKEVSYNLASSLNKNPWINGTDKNIALNISIPLANLFHNKGFQSDITNSTNNTAYATYSATQSNDGNLIQQAGLAGTLLNNNNLTYSITQGYTKKDNSSNGNLILDWQTGYGRANVGYNYSSKGYKQLNYGIRGGIIAHEDGITFSPPLGNTNILIKAPNAKNVKIENSTGIKTDWRGYAVIPYANSYHRNRVSLDSRTLDNNIELDDSVINVVPTNGALALAEFKVKTGSKVMVTLVKNNKNLPFGTIVSVNDNVSNGIVGDNGQVYLSGLPIKGKIKATWGKLEHETCEIPYELPNNSQNKTISYMTLNCLN